MASPLEVRVTILIIGAYAGLCLSLLPVAGVPIGPSSGIYAASVTGILVAEGATSFLLFVRFRQARSWPVLLLGCAYLYSGLMAGVQVFTLPGVVHVDRALLGVSTNASGWIYVAWINAYVTLAFAAVLAQIWRPGKAFSEHEADRTILIACALAVLGAATTCFAAFIAGDHLPLFEGNHFTAWANYVRWSTILVSAGSVAIILLVIRERLFLWLSLALVALAFHNVLSMASGAVYTLGWAIGRLSWLFSASALFIYFLEQFARQQNLLVRAQDLFSQGAGGIDLIGSSGDYVRDVESGMTRFISRENVKRYNELLRSDMDGAERSAILKLLGEEEKKLTGAT